MKDYCTEHWQQLLDHNNLGSFDRLWKLEADWFEPPNERRGGWSGVSRCDLATPDGGTVGMFLKRQENHITRTPRHPFGMSTFVREMNNILLFKRSSVPALEPIYFAVRRIDGNLRAILCTEALDGYESLEALTTRWAHDGFPDRNTRKELMTAVAAVMRQMHQCRIQHNCFYPKHIFVRLAGDGIKVRIIDLEKAKVRIHKSFATFRDLYTLNRHSQSWSRSDRLRFFLIYLDLEHLTPEARKLWNKIARRTTAKGRV